MSDDGYLTEASVSVEHDGIRSLEDSALALIEWIKDETGPVYVQVLDRETGQTVSVKVEHGTAVIPASETPLDGPVSPADHGITTETKGV